MNFFRILSKLRYGVLIAVISSLIGSALMFVVGGLKVYKGCYYFLSGIQPEWAPAHSTPSDLATILVTASLDSFLLGLALLYFGYGIYALVPSFWQAWAAASPCPDGARTMSRA